MIFLPTVRHSGTWFLQRLFQMGGYKVVNLDRMLFGGEFIPPNRKAVIHTHIDVNLPVVKALHARAPKPAHQLAINYYERLNDGMIEAFAKWLPVVMPMRDPLLSIITRHARHPEQAPHTYLVESWQDVPPEAFFVPVDRAFSAPERMAILRAMLKHCKVKPWPGIDAYARAWKPVNSMPGAPDARVAYKRKDAGWFEDHFPEEWEMLKEAAYVRRLFEKQGYEDLLWG